VIVEHNASGLIIRGENEKDNNWNGGRDRDVRQRVMLKLPRQVDLGVNGINGRVNVGAIDGPVRIGGINGRVEVEQAVGYSDLSGINGRVGITISRLGERGISVNGVNGGVELRFVDEVNADIDVTGINGSVNADVPNVVLRGKIDRQNFHATIGTGGTPIKVKGVNGEPEARAKDRYCQQQNRLNRSEPTRKQAAPRAFVPPWRCLLPVFRRSSPGAGCEPAGCLRMNMALPPESEAFRREEVTRLPASTYNKGGTNHP
jgi:hypothetical protein